ncbi:MAG: radical SAM protein [Nitrososphaerales archaeon]
MSNAEYKTHRPERILNVYKHCDGGWFWSKYSAHPYIGCEYGCLYCYEWDRKYNPYDDPEDFDRIVQVKKNTLGLLRKELVKKPIDLIAIGDWQPAEAKYRLSRGMLEVVLDLGFPVFINEKSPLVLRDLDLIKKINNKAYANIGFSIMTTKDDRMRMIFEPKAPTVRSRFDAMASFAKEGLSTGTVFMPILPYIYDDDENLEAVMFWMQVLPSGNTARQNCTRLWRGSIRA